MKYIKRGIMITLLIIVALIVFEVAYFFYVTEYKLTDVGTALSPDGQYSVSVWMVGEPAWPFGPVKVKVTVRKTKGNKQIKTIRTMVYNDGTVINESHWEASWSDDAVTIVLAGGEQEDEIYYVTLADE